MTINYGNVVSRSSATVLTLIPSEHEVLSQCWVDAGPAFQGHQRPIIGSMHRICSAMLSLLDVLFSTRLPTPHLPLSDQTTGLTLTTGVWEACTKRRGASNINIHHDVTGLLTVVWGSHSGQIVWLLELAGEKEGSELIAHIRDIHDICR